MAPKIKNPLLNKQALPGSYADYLTADRNNYAAAQQFDQIIANNEKIQNSPTPILTETITNAPTPTAVQRTYAAPVKMPAADTVVSGDQTAAASPNLIPIKSYTEWLEAGGMTGMAQKQYDAAVRAAETDYAKSKALYGQNAETLGRAGLTGSGYGDYLTGAGFAAMQGAKVAAADTRALTEAQQRSDYANYLMTVDAQNREIEAQFKQEQAAAEAQANAEAADALAKVDQLMLGGYTDDAIRAYIGQHYGDKFTSYVDGWLSNAHTYNDATLAQNTATNANAATAGYRSEIFKQLLSGVDPAIVRSNMEYSMMLAGEDTSQLDAWMAEAQAAAQPTLTKQQEEQAKVDADKAAAETKAAEAEALARAQAAAKDLATLVSNGLVADAARVQMRSLGYTEDEINKAIATQQNTQFAQDLAVLNSKGIEIGAIPTAAYIDNMKTAGQISEAQAIQYKSLAQTKRAALLKDDFYGFKDMDEDAATKAQANWKATIDSLSAEDLTDTARAELYGMMADGYISDAVEKKRPMSELLNEIRTIQSGNVGDVALKGFVDGVMDSVTLVDNKIKRVMNNTGGQDFFVQFDFGKREGKEKSVVQTVDLLTTGASADALSKLGEGNDGEAKTVDGKLYVCYVTKAFNGKETSHWVQVYGVKQNDVAGAENAKLMHEILVDYYS